MKNALCLFLCLSSLLSVRGQAHSKMPIHLTANEPTWVQLMYADNPNWLEVERQYAQYYNTHLFQKTTHTQYYKHVSRTLRPYLDANGQVDKACMNQVYPAKKNIANKTTAAANWQSVGPWNVKREDGTLKANHTNVYSVDQATTDPNIVYLGTETGEVYKSTDHGASWACTSFYLKLGGILSLEIDPADENHVLIGYGNTVQHTTDGGVNWSVLYTTPDLEPNEIVIHPSNTDLIWICGGGGLYQSTDGGAMFNEIYTESAYDIKINTANPSTMYLLKSNSALVKTEFLKSTDMGTTWDVMSTGWYSSTDPNRIDYGGRIGITQADPNRVYAYLIGASKAGDNGFIGLFRSNDAGETWTLPNAPTGGPYSTVHPNPTTFDDVVGTYNQGFYNCGIMVSNTNADDVLFGGLNLWRSNDGGTTFNVWAGYIGDSVDMHVDNQDFRSFGGEYYISTDGGLYRSTDFFYTQPQVLMNGVRSCEFWGFASGWNEDVSAGGLYHNGNAARHENYDAGDFINIGGGEAPTCYIDPANNRRIYTSDVGVATIPSLIDGTPTMYAGLGMSPTESYFAAESSEITFHPHCYSILFIGNKFQLFKSTDGGASFSLVNTFGTDTFDIVQDIEIALSNPEIMYLNQRPNSGSLGMLWKSSNGGATWVPMSMPSITSNSRVMTLSIDPSDANTLYVGYTYGSTGKTVYKTNNGGSSWQNISYTALGSEDIHELVSVPYTNGGVYAFTQNTVYYTDNSMTDWVSHADGLPSYISCTGAKPFYRDGKIKMASYGKGIWTGNMYQEPTNVLASITSNRLTTNLHCNADTFYFASTSIVNQAGASANWTFEGGTPASYVGNFPKVLFNTVGSHLVTLQVTNASGQTDLDSLYIDVNLFTVASTVQEDFEGVFLPTDWERYEPNGGCSWAQSNECGGFGASATCMKANNFDVDGLGNYTEVRFSINLEATGGLNGATLYFDVAHAEYGFPYTDSLEVLLSNDCGATFNSIYKKGGDSLQTAPNTNLDWTPTATEWRRDSIQLTAHIGNDDVIIAFRNIGYFGNNIYIDNINLSKKMDSTIIGISPLITQNETYFNLSPNLISNGDAIEFNTNIKTNFVANVYDANGKMIKKILNATEGSSLCNLECTTGNYYIEIISPNYRTIKKLVVIEARK